VAWPRFFGAQSEYSQRLLLTEIMNLIKVTIFSCSFVWPNALYLGHAVGQLVEALRYKREGCGFDSRRCHWNFSLTYFRPQYSPGVDSAPNRNEYKGYILETTPPSCADCLETWEPQPPGTIRACSGLQWDCFYTNALEFFESIK